MSIDRINSIDQFDQYLLTTVGDTEPLKPNQHLSLGIPGLLLRLWEKIACSRLGHVLHLRSRVWVVGHGQRILARLEPNVHVKDLRDVFSRLQSSQSPSTLPKKISKKGPKDTEPLDQHLDAVVKRRKQAVIKKKAAAKASSVVEDIFTPGAPPAEVPISPVEAETEPEAAYLQSREMTIEALDLARPFSVTEQSNDGLEYLDLARNDDFAGVLEPDVEIELTPLGIVADYTLALMHGEVEPRLDISAGTVDEIVGLVSSWKKGELDSEQLQHELNLANWTVEDYNNEVVSAYGAEVAEALAWEEKTHARLAEIGPDHAENHKQIIKTRWQAARMQVNQLADHVADSRTQLEAGREVLRKLIPDSEYSAMTESGKSWFATVKGMFTSDSPERARYRQILTLMQQFDTQLRNIDTFSRLLVLEPVIVTMPPLEGSDLKTAFKEWKEQGALTSTMVLRKKIASHNIQETKEADAALERAERGEKSVFQRIIAIAFTVMQLTAPLVDAWSRRPTRTQLTEAEKEKIEGGAEKLFTLLSHTEVLRTLKNPKHFDKHTRKHPEIIPYLKKYVGQRKINADIIAEEIQWFYADQADAVIRTPFVERYSETATSATEPTTHKTKLLGRGPSNGPLVEQKLKTDEISLPVPVVDENITTAIWKGAEERLLALTELKTEGYQQAIGRLTLVREELQLHLDVAKAEGGERAAKQVAQVLGTDKMDQLLLKGVDSDDPSEIDALVTAANKALPEVTQRLIATAIQPRQRVQLESLLSSPLPSSEFTVDEGLIQNIMLEQWGQQTGLEGYNARKMLDYILRVANDKVTALTEHPQCSAAAKQDLCEGLTGLIDPDLKAFKGLRDQLKTAQNLGNAMLESPEKFHRSIVNQVNAMDTNDSFFIHTGWRTKTSGHSVVLEVRNDFGMLASVFVKVFWIL